MPLRSLAQHDFSGGINAVASPFAVTQKQVFRSRNLLLDEHGSLTTRPGWSLLTTSVDTASPIIYLGILNGASGTTFPFHLQQSGVSSLYRTDTGTFVGSFLSGYATPQSVTVLNQEVFAAGYEVPWLWNGTALSNITAAGGQTVPPGAKHVAFHQSRLFVWNTNPTTTTLDGPSSLRQSDVNNPNSWPNANQTFISRDDGQQGQGLAVYTIAETGISPTTTLVAFKDRSGYQLTGTLDSSSFTIQKLKSDMGCIAPRTIQFVSGFGILRLTHKGFALFNGVDDKLVSEEVRPYIFGGDDVTGLSFANVGLSWAAQVSSPPLYVAVCPTTTTALDRLFVYDLVRRAWSICDFPSINLSTLVLYTDQTTVLPVVRAGTQTGGQILRVFNALDTTDGGAAVPWSFQTRNFGSPTQPLYYRRLTLDLDYAPVQSVNVFTSLGGVRSSLSQTLTYRGSAGSVYGTAVYGADTYGTGTQDYAEAQDLQRTATWANTTVSGSGVVRVRGLAYDVAEKPVKRLTTAGAV